jgi:hypothetical protein
MVKVNLVPKLFCFVPMKQTFDGQVLVIKSYKI